MRSYSFARHTTPHLAPVASLADDGWPKGGMGLQRRMQTDFNTVSLEVCLKGLRHPTREVIGASLEFEIRVTLLTIWWPPTSDYN
jgi:hypothetical protein